MGRKEVRDRPSWRGEGEGGAGGGEAEGGKTINMGWQGDSDKEVQRESERQERETDGVQERGGKRRKQREER